MSLSRLTLTAALLVAPLAAPAAAQASFSSTPRASVMPATPSAAPTLAQSSVGVQRVTPTPTPGTTPAPFRADTRQNRALMIVGGAALLTGAVVGGDAGTLISVGGAVVFLWGLYQFVQ